MLKRIQKIYDIVLLGWMNTSGILMVIILAIPAVMALFNSNSLEVLRMFLLSVTFLGGVIVGTGLRITYKNELTPVMAIAYFMVGFVIWTVISIALTYYLKISTMGITMFVVVLGLMEGIIFGFMKPAGSASNTNTK